ncbi:flavin reductase family protein [Streptomyces sp. NPDC048290]|uniref:flavin reductase family protein n=1 Tax=Streptomyces sp. NPDC048290 TaxID=3155811 RepID=UPI003422B177
MSQPDDLETVFRDTMAGVCTPVSVVTALSGEAPHGTTVNAFASLSMSPPMVLVSLAHTSELLGLIRQTGRFGLNILASDQAQLALTFARKGDAGRFTGVRWDIEDGVPRIAGTCGFLVCDVAELVSGGDHTVVQGFVRAAEAGAGAPLTYHLRSFGTHTVLTEGRDLS